MVMFPPTYAVDRRLLQRTLKVSRLVLLPALLLTWGPVARAQAAPDIAGVWKGTLVNLPLRPNATPVQVTMELGAVPTADGQCVPWKTTYSERDTVRATKNYRLCRGTGAQSLYVDEGDGVTLQTSLLGDVLVSSFKAGRVLLVTHLRVRGDTLEEEIITAEDLPATEGVVTMRSRSIQRLQLTRVRREI
ncbi:hypothetical protein [Gemmatimonas sp.]|jgi:hypothetical protein|uniref:hypothetical protein n=1 Tax=Gemmatimonas sp. TaxID=1962908 RepID=UPI0037C07642